MIATRGGMRIVLWGVWAGGEAACQGRRLLCDGVMRVQPALSALGVVTPYPMIVFQLQLQSEGCGLRD